MAVFSSTAAFGVAAWTQGAAFPGPPTSAAFGVAAAADAAYGGAGAIADTVAIEDPIGTPERPIRRRVSLLDRRTFFLVRSTIADPATGAYQFSGLRTDIPFMLVADDYAGTYNAVIADWIYAHDP